MARYQDAVACHQWIIREAIVHVELSDARFLMSLVGLITIESETQNYRVDLGRRVQRTES